MDVKRVSGRCWEGVRKVYERCLEGVLKASARSLHVKMVLESIKNHN